jgi:hypothetical protein
MEIRRQGDLEEVADRFQHCLAQMRRTWTPGTLTGDVNRFLNAVEGATVPDVWIGGWETLDPWRAARALARHPRFLPTWPADPVARGHIRQLVKERGRRAAERYLRDVVYPEAVMLAYARIGEPQYIRLDPSPRGAKFRRYVRDAAGPVRLKPEDLAVNGPFYRWLRSQAVRIATQLLADHHMAVRPETIPFYGSSAKFLSPVAFAGRPLSRREQTMFRMQSAGATHAEIARALGISRPAAKQLSYRLRRRSRHDVGRHPR